MQAKFPVVRVWLEAPTGFLNISSARKAAQDCTIWPLVCLPHTWKSKIPFQISVRRPDPPEPGLHPAYAGRVVVSGCCQWLLRYYLDRVVLFPNNPWGYKRMDYHRSIRRGSRPVPRRPSRLPRGLVAECFETTHWHTHAHASNCRHSHAASCSLYASRQPTGRLCRKDTIQDLGRLELLVDVRNGPIMDGQMVR